MTASSIFVSYRRDDAAASTGRLYDSLCAHFGDTKVVRDIDTIPPGVDFAKWISDAVGSCAGVIAVIGPSWLSATDKNGKRRLDDPKDFVRLEIAAALSRGVPVVPVMVEGASIPLSKDLPRPLKGLVRFNGLEVSDSHWKYDVSKLIDGLEQLLVVTSSAGEGPAVEALRTDPVPHPVEVLPSEAPAPALPVDAPLQPFPQPVPGNELVHRLLAPGIDTDVLVAALSEWFRLQKFEVQPLPPSDGPGVQARQAQGWRKTLGMSAAMHVRLDRSGDELVVAIGASKWTDNTAGLVTGYLLTAGVSTVVGVWQHQRLPERVIEFLGDYVSSGGREAVSAIMARRSWAAGQKARWGHGTAPPPQPTPTPMSYPPPQSQPYQPPAHQPPAHQPAPAAYPPPQSQPAASYPPPSWQPPPAAGYPPSQPPEPFPPPPGSYPPPGQAFAPPVSPAPAWPPADEPVASSATCQQCGAAAEPTARFCAGCGTRLG